MTPTGSGNPPSIMDFTSACTTAGTSIVTFSCNKVISASVLGLTITDLATGNIVWSGGFGQYTNVQPFTVLSLPNGDYELEANNGENGTLRHFSVDCTAVPPPPPPPAGTPPIYGCMNQLALNYNPLATQSDDSCVFAPVPIQGCTNKRARNYDATATVDDGTCEFGPVGGAQFSYDDARCLTVVYNEPLDLFVTEQTYRAQMLLTIDGKRLHSLPLPGVSIDRAGRAWLWEHNAGPAAQRNGLQLYGRIHSVWLEVVTVGPGVQATKNVDNVVLVANEELPTRLEVTAPEQGTFTQTFITTGHRLSLTCRRHEQMTYAVVNPPQDGVWGGRIRAQWTRLRFYFAAKTQLRISNLVVLLRESVS